MDKTKVKLRICDIDCTITSDDNEEYVRTIGGEIDRAISAVLKKNDRISLSMAAIITAMTYCDDSDKAKAELAELKTIEKNAVSEYDRLKQEADAAKTQAEQLRSELQTLHTFLTTDKNVAQLPLNEEALQSSAKTPQSDSDQEMIFRCINGKPTYVPKEALSNQTSQLYDAPAPVPATVEEAHTLEELCNTLQAAETLNPNSDNPLEGIPAVANPALQKHNKQSRLIKKQQKMAQKSKDKDSAQLIPPSSPVQRAEHPVPEVLTGSFTRPKSPFVPELPSDDTFISYFEKK